MSPEGADPSDRDLVRYFIDEGYGCDLAYIAEETGNPLREVARLARTMEQLVRVSVT